MFRGHFEHSPGEYRRKFGFRFHPDGCTD
jgi:AraC family transcriptional regulator of arabinose operon